MRQLVLPVALKKEAVFHNFYISPANQKLIHYLLKKDGVEKLIYLYAPVQSGLTHVLQALCHEKKSAGLYIPLKQHAHFLPEILDNLENMAWVILDDIPCITGKEVWEKALFYLFNRIQSSTRAVLIFAGHVKPSALALDLPDLKSRILSMLCLSLQVLSDEEKAEALRCQARVRGLRLSSQTIRYLLHHAPRSMTALMDLLDQLDKISLQEKQNLTVSLVKKILRFS